MKELAVQGNYTLDEFHVPYHDEWLPPTGWYLHSPNEVRFMRPGVGKKLNFNKYDAYGLGATLAGAMGALISDRRDIPDSSPWHPHTVTNAPAYKSLSRQHYSPALFKLIEGLLDDDVTNRWSLSMAYAYLIRGYSRLAPHECVGLCSPSATVPAIKTQQQQQYDLLHTPLGVTTPVRCDQCDEPRNVFLLRWLDRCSCGIFVCWRCRRNGMCAACHASPTVQFRDLSR